MTLRPRKHRILDLARAFALDVATDPTVQQAIRTHAIAAAAKIFDPPAEEAPVLQPENWPYTVLGIPSTSTAAEANARYRALARAAVEGQDDTWLTALNLANQEIQRRANNLPNA